jgi:hypothetical protein
VLVHAAGGLRADERESLLENGISKHPFKILSRLFRDLHHIIIEFNGIY